MFRHILLAFFFVFLFHDFSAQNPPKNFSTPLNSFYIENKGQWDNNVSFLTRTKGLDAWVLRNGNFLFDSYITEFNKKGSDLEKPFNPEERYKDAVKKGHRILFKWMNSNSSLSFNEHEKQLGNYNYLIGNDPATHASDVHLYAEVIGENLYSGIDLRYYHQNSSMRYDLIVQPNADPSQIKLRIDGADKLKISEKGDVLISTSLGEIDMQDLYVYEQETKKQVDCKWILNSNELTLDIDDYNRNNTLIIDPLIYSTFIGGSTEEYSRDIAVDNLGNAYITGSTQSANYDITLGSYQTSYAGIWDAYISKFNPAGSALIFSTYIGGNSAEHSRGIAIDSIGNSYITGYTVSNNFAVTSGAYQTAIGSAGNGDVFVTKLNSIGTTLVYSTYIGGTLDEQGFGIALDGMNNAYVTGWTISGDYDVTPGTIQTSIGGSGSYDAFLTKLNSSGSALVYSTYLGGGLEDKAQSIVVDSLGNAYVTGHTYSLDFDTTPGAYQPSLTPSSVDMDVFVSKINPAGSALVYSTFLGGTSFDLSFGINIDALGNAYITGETGSVNFDITSGAFQATHGDGGTQSDAFVTKLNQSGSGLIYSTFLGGSSREHGYDITIDDFGSAYLTGATYSANFPTTTGAEQSVNDGLWDAFVAKLNINGSLLNHSTYLGGSSLENAFGIAKDQYDGVFITGQTNSSDYDITPGAFQTLIGNSTYNVFVTKIGICPTINFNIISSNVTCNGDNNGSATIAISGDTTGYSYNWMPSVSAGFSASGLSSGSYTITVADSNGCTAQQILVITEPAPINADVAGQDSICLGQNAILNGSGSGVYNWSTGDTTTSVLVNPVADTTYSLIVSNGGCNDTAYFSVNILSSPNAAISGTDTICNGQTVNLIASGGLDYLWNTGDTSGSIAVNPIISTSYSVIVSNAACSDTAQLFLNVIPIPSATISGQDTICSGQITTLNAYGGDEYLWNTGDTSSSINVNPAANTNYSVIVSNEMCSDTSFITVNVFSVPSAGISGTDSICQGQEIILSANGGGPYLWNTGAVSDSLIINPIANTIYNVIVSNGVCNDTAEFSIQVHPLPVAGISGPDSLCTGQSVTLTATGGTGYTWNTGASTASITNTPISDIIYSVIVSNAFGCRDTMQQNVYVIPLPLVNISGVNEICDGEDISLTAFGIGDFLWSTGNTSSLITISPSVTTSYFISASNTCGVSTDTIIVDVNPVPVLSVSNDTTIILGNSLQLNATGAGSYLWSPGTGLSCVNCSNPDATPQVTTSYSVTGTDVNGCASFRIITIIVDSEFEIFIPDIFSPNNDGQNDVLYVRGSGIKELSFKIYDRLGEMIFESNDQQQGWDGSFKGSSLNPGVFVYYVSAKMVNDKEIHAKGDITLIR